MKLVRYVLVVLLAVLLTGLPWLGLKVISKVHQAYRNTHQNGFAFALKQIPKGKDNCSLCKKISLARAQQYAQQHGWGQAGCGLIEFSPALISANLFVIPPLDGNSGLIATLSSWHALAHCPPTPPPKA